MKEILDEVLGRITPSIEEKEAEKEVIAKVMSVISEFPVDPIVVGSTAKDTDLSGDKDIDIFMRFPKETTREELEEKGLGYGKSVFKKLGVRYEIDYSEHPYTKGVFENHLIELVPCYAAGGIQSSVDRTPLHTKYVKGKLSANPGLNSDIRLMKRFMKALDVYGAEEKVRGFSGYLIEILVIYYGGFEKMLKAASGWSSCEIIDVQKQWDSCDSLKYYFTNNSFIVVDPVDKDRNVSAALSNEKLSTFIVTCREFLDDPSIEYFFPVPLPLRSLDELKKDLKGRGSRFFAVKLDHAKINENMLYGQLRKTVKSIVKEFESREFSVFKTCFWTNEVDVSIMLFEFSVSRLPKIKHHLGPPIKSDTVHQEKFHEKYQADKPYILNDRWVVDTERKLVDASDYFKIILRDRGGFGKTIRDFKASLLCDLEVFDVGDEGWLRTLDEYLGN